MRKFRLFINPVEGRKKWLNEQASKGLRLKHAGRFLYTFEPSAEPYEYDVQYIGYMANWDRKEYESFLQQLDFNYWTVSINVGKFAFGSVRLRPYARGVGKVATSPGMIGQELMILEKRSDGKPFDVFSDEESVLESLQERQKPYLYTSALLAVFLWYIVFVLQDPTWILILPGLLLLYCLYFAVLLGKMIRKQRERCAIHN
ncbi:MAG: DUF2812 domain-containing protein [Firmicutes bacterium]|jgi:hypothetical protein|nr:DUF2812 domain-containing protein [Bacillota bacterium]